MPTKKAVTPINNRYNTNTFQPVLPLAYFALASGSTGAGMINHSFENPPRFLLIDEIEDMKQSDQATLCRMVALLRPTRLGVQK